MQLTQSKFEIYSAPEATGTFICTSLMFGRDSIKTEFQCDSIEEVETLLGATMSASLCYISPLRLIFINLKCVFQNELARYQTILANLVNP